MNYAQIELDIVYHLDGAARDLVFGDEARFRRAAQWIANQFRMNRFYASIAIVDDPTIQQVNAEELGHDWPTDVISFLLDEEDDFIEGEVIASAETAKRICAAAGWSAEDELLLYVVHGLLHVAGMDDTNPIERQEMRLMEKDCLLAIGVHLASEHLQRWDSITHSESYE